MNKAHAPVVTMFGQVARQPQKTKEMVTFIKEYDYASARLNNTGLIF